MLSHHWNETGERGSTPERAVTNPVVLGGVTFMLGFTAGLFMRDAAGQLYHRVRRGMRHHPTGTIVYDENLPDSLQRREPVAHAGQPRYGGTGALGVSPRAVDSNVGHLE